MLDNLEQLKERTLSVIENAASETVLGEVENKTLGRAQGEFTQLMKNLKDLPAEERKVAGEKLNEVKNILSTAFAKKRSELAASAWALGAEAERVDITEPSLPTIKRGHFHPTTIVRRDLEQLFGTLGFVVLDGPELESEYYNFTALNIPPTHPARDMQDTFYIKGHAPADAKAMAGTWVMRTHTSPMQVRAMQKYGAPLRIIVPGTCYRNEATDVRHEHTFHQMEGLVIAENINISHMKGVLEAVAQHLYGADTKVRLRPKYYPFVEPGVNGEVTCFSCAGQGCRLCKQTGWLEIFGAGMVHPSVLKEGGVDSQKYSGFAFGFGLTRLVMLKYGITDIRLLESGNMKFLEQF